MVGGGVSLCPSWDSVSYRGDTGRKWEKIQCHRQVVPHSMTFPQSLQEHTFLNNNLRKLTIKSPSKGILQFWPWKLGPFFFFLSSTHNLFQVTKFFLFIRHCYGCSWVSKQRQLIYQGGSRESGKAQAWISSAHGWRKFPLRPQDEEASVETPRQAHGRRPPLNSFLSG